MSQEPPQQGDGSSGPPVSVFAGPIAELIGHRLLSPPNRPGLLASLGGWEVLRVLGGGGMGVVVLARDAATGRDVAIKMVKPELVSNQGVVHRFVREAGHLQKLQHPNIVPVLEVSDRAEGPYFVMPYFDQGSLASRIKPGRPMERAEVLEISRQVAAGLVFAHRQGIIHRDLKPANILLGTGGKVCLADFGLARTMFNDTLIDVESRQVEGTAPYMSPGVAAGNAEDTRCDIYSFGALMYEMLTGEAPYTGRNTEDIRRQILARPPKPIKDLNPSADDGLTSVAENAMGRELRERYADMADVLADLNRVHSGKTPAGPHGITRSSKPLPFSLWIPAGLALIGVGLWLMWPPARKVPPITPMPDPPVSNSIHPQTATNPIPAPATNAIPVVVTTAPPPAPVPPAPVAPRTWSVSLLAGQPGKEGSADGPGPQALFKSPGGIAATPAGDVFVADTGNNTVRKISTDGTVSTLAGSPGKVGELDGEGDEARFLAPWGIAVDSEGSVYVAEFAGDLIRRISTGGTVTTLAGSRGNPGSRDGVGDNAHFRNPWSVAAATVSGNILLFVADKSNFTIRQVALNGLVGTVAGVAGKSGFADGPGAYARFADPQSVACDAMGSIYVADAGNFVLRRIKQGVVETFAGKAGKSGFVDGSARDARFSDLQALACRPRPQDGIYVLDGDSLRAVDASGTVSTMAASAMTDPAGNPIHAVALTTLSGGSVLLTDRQQNVVWEVKPPSP